MGKKEWYETEKFSDATANHKSATHPALLCNAVEV